MSDEEIKALWIQTHDRITELFLRVIALQTLLQQTGAFSDADVQRRIEEIQNSWSASFRQDLLESRRKQAEEQIRLLLESYEGTKQ